LIEASTASRSSYRPGFSVSRDSSSYGMLPESSAFHDTAMVFVSDCADRPLRSNAAASTFTGFFASRSDGCGWRTPRTTATADSVPPGSAKGAATTLSGTSLRGRTPSIAFAVSGAIADATRSPPRLPPA
jgi:hypothetical protein